MDALPSRAQKQVTARRGRVGITFELIAGIPWRHAWLIGKSTAGYSGTPLATNFG
jgi:hypothetical protein